MGSVALTGITMMSSCMTSRTKRSTRQAKCRAEGRELSAQLAAKLDSFRAMLFRSRPHIRIQKEETGVVTMSDLASTSRVAPPPVAMDVGGALVGPMLSAHAPTYLPDPGRAAGPTCSRRERTGDRNSLVL